MVWVRIGIRSDPQHFAGSWSRLISASSACRSDSVDQDPAGPDRYQVQANKKIDKLTSFKKTSVLGQKIQKIMAHFDTDEK